MGAGEAPFELGLSHLPLPRRLQPALPPEDEAQVPTDSAVFVHNGSAVSPKAGAPVTVAATDDSATIVLPTALPSGTSVRCVAGTIVGMAGEAEARFLPEAYWTLGVARHALGRGADELDVSGVWGA